MVCFFFCLFVFVFNLEMSGLVSQVNGSAENRTFAHVVMSLRKALTFALIFFCGSLLDGRASE